jgi:hypothetical protein
MVQLLGFPADVTDEAKPTLLDIERIEKITLLDVTFVPRQIDMGGATDA